MKKLFSLSDNLVMAIEQYAKENQSSQSQIVEAAVTLFLQLPIAVTRVKKVDGVVVPRGQQSIDAYAK